ncbi:LytTR family DNA-binding domain-containing protein [Flavobacterium sp. UGB4466]|uniref:LytR/AlgR family response regulator transcription factor n=1 Tax=Flavobacterium sp. UGB4466 TaxID=2730889 RepID=UPI001ED948B1|nr:LytTR family DNA-binding domain-containing protein [Flavobacterium sp. UGB4466]
MFQSVIDQIFQSKQKPNFIITACVLLFVFTNVVLDYSFTLFQNSAFYISESLLFSSYWVLFLPLLIVVLKWIRKTENLTVRILVISAAILLHLFSYPILVWIISKAFYDHTFSYWQTFNFGLSAYFIKTVIIYGFSLMVFILWNRKSESLQLKEKIDEQRKGQNFIRSILISDPHNKKLLLEAAEILYFEANSPYINIYHSSKKYLHTQTLRALETQLDEKQFVRIHKSHIVNISKISSIQSRQNGDYDVTLCEDTILRVSRNYAKNFKSKFSEHNQLTLK